MISLEKSDVLGRAIRRGDVQELAKPTWQLVREAIQAGRTEEALTFLDYAYFEFKSVHDSLCVWVDVAFSQLAQFGEEEIYNVVSKRYGPRMRRWLIDTPGAEESLERGMEYHRAHGGNLTVQEEPSRYVVTLDPCGSGGQLKRKTDFGIAQKAYDWTWKKSGVSLYCSHCCVMWEIIPIEVRGYPIRITNIGEKPEDPCVHLYYKKPELIPEEYFTRVGRPVWKE